LASLLNLFHYILKFFRLIIKEQVFLINTSPNRISVGQKNVTITMENACLTGEQLKKVSDDTLSQDRVDISEIELNGNVIWSKS